VQGLQASTQEFAVSRAFSQFRAIKEVRHFPRRGFAFVEFHSCEDAKIALHGFRKSGSIVDGVAVSARFAEERKELARGAVGVEQAFLEKQALAEANKELDRLAQQKLQQDNATKALSGVNSSMWASYMNSVTQTEMVQASKSFSYDKDSGFYANKDAGLLYDPNTTYFFTLDYKKYFVFDPQENMLCLVGPDGQKVLGGERRPIPSADETSDTKHPGANDHANHGSGGQRTPERSRNAEIERRSRSRSHSRQDVGASATAPLPQASPLKIEVRPRPPVSAPPPMPEEDQAKPIYFPGGDPLARLAPAESVPPVSPLAAQPPQKKRNKRGEELVMGLAVMPKGLRRIPGPVKIKRAGPVKVSKNRGNGGGWSNASSRHGLDNMVSGVQKTEWICEVCMRKFGSQEQLERHEQLSELHKENLAKLQTE